MSPLDLLWLFFILSSLQPVLQRRWLDYQRARAFTALEKKRQSRVIGLIHRQETMAFLGFPLARYIDTVRPPSLHPEVFLGLNSPRRPLGRSGIYKVVSPRILALGIEVARRGPHALRHACAARLVAEGLTFKEIGDHLGHRSSSATSAYAKVDLAALREVGDFDLGDLQ